MRTSLTSGNCTRRLSRTSRPRIGRRHAIGFMAAAFLLALPLSAHSQGTAPFAAPAAPGTTAVGAPATDATQPAAANPTAPTPSSSLAPSSAPSSGAAPVAAAAPSATPAPAAAPLPGEHVISSAELPEDLSPWGMFENSDLVVKAVIIGLAFASFVTWTVWVAKTLELRGARGAVRRDLRVLNHSVTLAQAHDHLRDGDSPVSQLMRAAGQEIRLSANLRADGLKERIALQLERIEMAMSRKVSRGTGVLATIGSTAPFVGLFGTVWGIMNSFIGISNAHTTNLAIVAPGIAQALLATAFGLVAAIPAVMIYNVLARQSAHYRAYLGDASAQVMRLVSRDLDRAKLPMTQAAE
jgi:biopolymer transport protein ExbB